MPVTPDDVVNAYRWLLGREPAPDEVALWLGIGSREELRRATLASREFGGLMAAALPAGNAAMLAALSSEALRSIPVEDAALFAEAARRFGLPYPIGHFYLPLVRPDDLRTQGIDRKMIVHPERLFSEPGIRSFARQLKPHARADLPANHVIRALELGLGYGPVSVHIYYQVVRAFTPDLIVEIGAGVSTWYAREALRGGTGRIVCIEPYPTPQFREWCAQNQVELWDQRLQQVLDRLDFPQKLLVFVDSTHTASIISEVNDIFLDLVHRLPSGTLLHFDDIFLPFACLHGDHSSFAQTANWYESVLLAIFLLASDGRYQTVFPEYAMGTSDWLRPILEDAVPIYNSTHWKGGSYWIRKA